MKCKISFLFLLILFPLFFSGCARRIYQVSYPTLSDGKYDSEFPYKNSSRELQQIAETVRKITAIAYYKSYIFRENQRITVADIQNSTYLRKANKEIFYNNSVIGTAIVLHSDKRSVLFLTCAHVIDFADTVITYFEAQGDRGGPFIRSVAFKKRQSNFVADLPERGDLTILAADNELDIAVLGKKYSRVIRNPIPVFNYPLGQAAQLEWGSFVYMLGFPKGYQMITRGIVSQPDRDKNHAFLVDALFNKGFSGGIVLAIRDGVPNFELVGIASSVAAEFEYKLRPYPHISKAGYDPRLPYTGDSFVEFQKNIIYGITFVISAESIYSFLKKHRMFLNEEGYDLPEIF